MRFAGGFVGGDDEAGPFVGLETRPGGHFRYADFRGRSEFSGWEAALADTQMRQVSERITNPEVLRGLEKNSQRSLELIGRLLPAFLRPFGRRFAGVPGTGLYRGIQSGKIEYRMYCFTE